MAVRQNQSPQQNQSPDQKETKSVYLPKSLVKLANRQAAKEGHYNFSTLVTKALTAYLNRRKANTDEAAGEAA